MEKIMLNTKRGFGSAGVIIAILLIIGAGGYLWRKKSAAPSIDSSFTTLMPAPNFTDENIVRSINFGQGQWVDGVYEISIPDRVGPGSTDTFVRITDRVDLNSDSREDAILQVRNCGASCNYSVYVVLNTGSWPQEFGFP